MSELEGKEAGSGSGSEKEITAREGTKPEPARPPSSEVKLRTPFDRFPHPYVYAFLLDALDLFGGFLPIAGELLDFVQTILALLIYENRSIALFSGAADLVLLGLPDIIPTYTIRVFLAERGLMN